MLLFLFFKMRYNGEKRPENRHPIAVVYGFIYLEKTVNAKLK